MSMRIHQKNFLSDRINIKWTQAEGIADPNDNIKPANNSKSACLMKKASEGDAEMTDNTRKMAKMKKIIMERRC